MPNRCIAAIILVFLARPGHSAILEAASHLAGDDAFAKISCKDWCIVTFNCFSYFRTLMNAHDVSSDQQHRSTAPLEIQSLSMPPYPSLSFTGRPSLTLRQRVCYGGLWDPTIKRTWSSFWRTSRAQQWLALMMVGECLGSSPLMTVRLNHGMLLGVGCWASSQLCALLLLARNDRGPLFWANEFGLEAVRPIAQASIVLSLCDLTARLFECSTSG
jgi:hypothetical protein